MAPDRDVLRALPEGLKDDREGMTWSFGDSVSLNAGSPCRLLPPPRYSHARALRTLWRADLARRALGLTLDSVPRLLLTELPGAFWLFYLCIPTRRPLSPPPESGPRGTRHRSGSEEAGEVSRGSERGHHGPRGAGPGLVIATTTRSDV